MAKSEDQQSEIISGKIVFVGSLFMNSKAIMQRYIQIVNRQNNVRWLTLYDYLVEMPNYIPANKTIQFKVYRKEIHNSRISKRWINVIDIYFAK
ncbi:MAG TPA: hypothetical protein PL108_01305 [Sediminibacterium sp.]|jgi:hypothetical protein|nr:MAG: hypothetical protein BWY38_02843 [Ignavibacteria bacterium ADurb.Bin266]HPH36264.1 hypothetical protein [Sediminibacterium sp.]